MYSYLQLKLQHKVCTCHLSQLASLSSSKRKKKIRTRNSQCIRRWINHAIIIHSIYTHSHTHSNNAQSPFNARLLNVHNANCAWEWKACGGGQGAEAWLVAERTFNSILLIRHVSAWQRRLLPAGRIVSKFISNNYAAINKPMPPITGGRADGRANCVHYSCNISRQLLLLLLSLTVPLPKVF